MDPSFLVPLPRDRFLVPLTEKHREPRLMIATPSIFIVSLRQLFASSATATSLRSLPQSATRTKRNVKRSVRILVRFPRIRMKGRPVRDAVPSISSDWTGPSYVPAIMHFLSISLFTLLSESQIRIQTPKPRDGENEGKRRLYPAFHLYLHPDHADRH